MRLIEELMPWHFVQEPRIAFSIAKILAACRCECMVNPNPTKEETEKDVLTCL